MAVTTSLASPVVAAGTGLLSWGFPLLAASALLTLSGFALLWPAALVAVFAVSSVNWLPLAEVGFGASRLTISVADIAVLLIVLSSVLCPRKVGPIEHEGRRYTIGSTSVLVLCTLLLPLPFALASLLYLSPSIAAYDTLIFAKRFVMYSLVAWSIPRLRGGTIAETSLGSALLTGIVVAAGAVAQFMVKHDRVAGVLFYENNLGLYAVAIFNLGVSFLAVRTGSAFQRLVGLAASAAAVAALGVSGSRAASLGFIASAFYWLSHRWVGKARTRGRVLAGILMLSLTLAFLFGGLGARWESAVKQGIETPQLAARLEASAIGLRMLMDHPVLGVGPSGVRAFSPWYVESVSRHFARDVVVNVGNQFLQVAVEGGLIGLTFFALWLAQFYRIIRSAVRTASAKPVSWIASKALMSTFVGLLVAGVGMHTFYVPQVMGIVWLLVGVLARERARFS